MNEKEAMNLLNSVDDDLIDKKIDDLLNQRGESVNIMSIKEKAMDKLNERESKGRRISKKVVVAAAIAAALTISTVYAGEISKAIQSFFNKSTVYSTVVDGDAYYLPEEVILNDRFTLLNVTMSKDELLMTIKSNESLNDKGFENLNLAVIPMNNEQIRYSVGGYMPIDNGECFLRFYNETANSNDIEIFKDFKFIIGDESYDISLAKAENLKVDENLVIGKSENTSVDKSTATENTETNDEQNTPIIANVAGSIKASGGITNIQLVAGFDDPELKLRALGESDFTEFTHKFENNENGTIGSGNSSMTKPILSYDKDNNSYTLKIPEDAVGRPVTVFETDAKPGTDLTVKLPAILAGYEKEVENLSISIPKEGEVTINKELDFIIQKANVKSIKRISEDSAVVEFELNTGNDKTVFINDMGAYSSDVIKAETIINGNTATMTMTFDKSVEKVDFSFSWPNYTIQGNWSIELGSAK